MLTLFGYTPDISKSFEEIFPDLEKISEGDCHSESLDMNVVTNINILADNVRRCKNDIPLISINSVANKKICNDYNAINSNKGETSPQFKKCSDYTKECNESINNENHYFPKGYVNKKLNLLIPK